jgi:hypothetical protein
MRYPIDYPVWLSQNEKLDIDFLSSDYTSGSNAHVPVESIKEANALSSKTKSGHHKVLLDLDVEHYYVPSSTEGHGHLYINVDLSTAQYNVLLFTLQHLGIIQKGFALLSIKRGFAALRFPWVKKEVPLF